MIVRIDDPHDPRLSPYRAVRERDLVGRDRLFVAEGRVVLEKAIAAIPEALESVLVAEHRLGGLADVLGGLRPTTPVYAAGQAVMDAVVGFPIHRGVLAVGRRPEREVSALLAGLPDRALVVGLVGIANHDNMGGVFRNAAAGRDVLRSPLSQGHPRERGGGAHHAVCAGGRRGGAGGRADRQRL